MGSLAKSENHSLRYHYLDNGINNEARNMPMASANFGAESGAYFLKSAPPTDQYPEYQLAPDPHAAIVDESSCQVSNERVKRHRKKKKVMGAQVEKVVVELPQQPTVQPSAPEKINISSTCTAVRWETLPSCMIDSVLGVTQDLSQRFRVAPENRQPLGDVFLKNNRLTYLLILFLLLFFVYRIFRQ